MFELFPKTKEGIAADETEPDDIELVIVPVAADKADDDRYSAKMCPQPVELILDAISEMLPKNRKRERTRRPPAPRVIFIFIHASSRPRQHRSTSRGHGGTKRDDGSSGDSDGGGDPPPQRSGGVPVLERGGRS